MRHDHDGAVVPDRPLLEVDKAVAGLRRRLSGDGGRCGVAAKFLGDLFWKGGDQKIIDGLGPDGVSAVSMRVGKGAGRLQTGFLYHYAFVMLLGVAAILTYALWAWNV